MKKISKFLAVILSIIIICATLPFGVITVSAAKATEGYYTYSVTDGQATIKDCSTSISGKVTIPSTLGGYPVTSIGDWAFEGCARLTSVTIPVSVTSIGNGAFYSCTNLTSITIPNSVTSIGYRAFKGCTGLTSVTIGNSVTNIGGDAFYNTAYYNDPSNWTDGVLYINDCLIAANNDVPENYTVKNGTRLIAGNAFSGCTGLTSVSIPNSVTSIGEWAFEDCTGLTIVTIEYGVTNIGYGAFSGCKGLTSVTIPDSVTSIGNSAFSGCKELTSVTIPNSVTTIGNWAFYDCTGLTSVTIGNSVTSIGGYAFYGTAYYNDPSNRTDGVLYINDCLIAANNDVPKDYTVKNGTRLIADGAFSGLTGLTSVTIPNSVTSIGDYAFSSCTWLTSVTVPDSVTSIGDYAFNHCTGLESIAVDINNPEYHSAGNCLIETASKTLICGCKNSIIPSDGSVTSIGFGAFDDCTRLTSVTIPDSVTSIGECAFYGCTGLISITIPNSLTSIGDYAFRGCTGLESIAVDINNPKYHSTGNCLIETASKTLICGCKNSIIPSDGSVTSIGDNAFDGCTGLTSVTIPDSVTSIDDWAFSGCNELTDINIPDSVISIGDSAFYINKYYNDPSNWTDGVLYIEDCLIEARISGNYTVKNGTRLIADGAFDGCTGLNSITIPNSVTSIGDSAFVWCAGLTSVTIPDSVTSIGDNAFDGCTGLTSVTIPDSVTSIGDSAFVWCAGLTSVTIPNSVTSIGDYAFKGCTGLESITIPNSVTSIGWDSFYGCDNLKTVYYFGTPENFEALVKYYNDWLLDLEIIYMLQLESGNVELTVERGVLEEGTVFSAEKIDSNLEQIAEQLPEEYDAESIVVYELNLIKDGEKVEFDGTVTVTVPLPEGMNPNKCRVLYMADDGSLTDMKAVYKDGAMVFNTTHFSTYILVKDNKVTPGDLDGNEEITDADAVYLLMYTFFPEDYPINQDCDFDGNGAVTDADAVYLLMYTFFPDDYPIVKAQAPIEPGDPGETEPDPFNS